MTNACYLFQIGQFNRRIKQYEKASRRIVSVSLSYYSDKIIQFH